MPYVNGIHKAGMHEATRIAQILLQREAEMAMLAAAGRRVHDAKAHRLPPADEPHRVGDAPDDRRGAHGGHGDGDRRRDDGEADGPPERGRIDLTA